MQKENKNQESKSKMTNRNSKRKRGEICPPHTSKFAFCLLLFAFVFGCAVVDFVKPDAPPYYRQLWQAYNHTNLKESTAADVITTIYAYGPPEYELLSQSKSVVASLGQKKKTYHTWLNMVAFDENKLTAKRKYLLVINERPRILFAEPWEGVTYDSEMVLESEVFDKPYGNESAQRIAILKQVSENVRRDIDEVGSDNKMVDICGMVIHQAFETILQKLDGSPVLASKLNAPSGVTFDHVSFDKGKIQMIVVDDIVTVKMMLGSFVRYFEKRQKPQQGEEVENVEER